LPSGPEAIHRDGQYPEGNQRDSNLVAGALRGTADDVEAFIDRMRCIPRILGVLNGRLGSGLSPDDLGDLAQDTLVIVWRKLSHYDGRSSLESWAYGIAWMEMRNAVRRRNRRPTTLADVTDARLHDATPKDGTFDEERIRNGLSRLDPAEETILRMRHFEELTFESAASKLGISVSAAKSRYYRGLEKLRGILGSGTREAGT